MVLVSTRQGSVFWSQNRSESVFARISHQIEGSKQLGHFVFGQMLTDAVHFVGIPPDLALIA